MDVRTSFAALSYARAKPATAAEETATQQGPVAGLIGDFAETLRTGEETAKAAMVGGADPHALVEALAAT